jgi:hypothetical protein
VRNFTICAAEQRSPEWKQARCGRLTASRAKDMLATVKSGEAAARRDLRTQLVLERLTGEPQDDVYVNADMQRGVDMEPAAFAAYEALTGHMPDRCGFVAHNEHLVGCSPDGVLDGFAGIVELKVPRSATHLSYLRAGKVPPEHLAQVTHSLWVTGADYCDFLSYDPRFPVGMQTFYVRVERDAQVLDAYEQQALAFLAEVEKEYQAIRSMTQTAAVLREVTHAL